MVSTIQNMFDEDDCDNRFSVDDNDYLDDDNDCQDGDNDGQDWDNDCQDGDENEDEQEDHGNNYIYSFDRQNRDDELCDDDLFIDDEEEDDQRRKHKKKSKQKLHPFVLVENIYNNKIKEGKPFKNWTMDRVLNRDPKKYKSMQALLFALLYKHTLFYEVIKKKENCIECSDSLDQKKEDKGTEYADPSSEKISSIDSECLLEEVKKIWDAASEEQKAACYYRFKNKDAFLKSKDRCRSKNDPYNNYEQEYKLSDLEIEQIVRVKKTKFYNAPAENIVKPLGYRLIELGFKYEDALYAYQVLLSPLVYAWAQNSNICKAMDEAVAQKNAKKLKTLPEITGTLRF